MMDVVHTLPAALATHVCAGLTAAMFLASAIGKVRDINKTASIIASYRLLPLASAFPAAYILIAANTLTGLALLCGLKTGAITAAALLLTFAAAMAVNVARGRTNITCGCLPGMETTLGGAPIARTLAWILPAAAVLAAQPTTPVIAIEGAVLGATLFTLGIAAMVLTENRNVPA